MTDPKHDPDRAGKPASPAERARAEAVDRRKALDEAEAKRPREINGRKGPDPARYGDWEVKGIVSDF